MITKNIVADKIASAGFYVLKKILHKPMRQPKRPLKLTHDKSTNTKTPS